MRNLNQFSEFQLGYIQAIANAVGGTVILSMLVESASVLIRSKQGIAFFKWIHGDDPMLWTGTEYVTLPSQNMMLPEYLDVLHASNHHLQGLVDALNALVDDGAFDKLGDATDAAAKFFDSLGDATVDPDEDDEEDGS